MRWLPTLHDKGKSTDQAESYHHLVLSAKYTINLTGTLFGGKSTDLFWLRYRVDPDVRRSYGFSDEQLWAQHYGRIERTFNKQQGDNDYGKFSGKERYVVDTKEIPGISPAIFARLLKSCIFVRITDLGYGLPAYQEEEAVIDLVAEPAPRPSAIPYRAPCKPLATPKPCRRARVPSGREPQLSFLDLEVANTDAQTPDQPRLPYSWSESGALRARAVIAKPVGRELKQMVAGQQSFADLFLAV